MTLTSLPVRVPDHVGYAKGEITYINEYSNRPIFSRPLYVGLYEDVTVETPVLTVLLQTSHETVWALLSLPLLSSGLSTSLPHMQNGRETSQSCCQEV